MHISYGFACYGLPSIQATDLDRLPVMLAINVLIENDNNYSGKWRKFC